MPNKQVTAHISSGISQEGFHQVNVSGDGVHPGLKGMILGHDPAGTSPWGTGLMVRVFFEEPFSNNDYVVLQDENSDADLEYDDTNGLGRHTHWVDVLLNTVPSEAVTLICLGD